MLSKLCFLLSLTSTTFAANTTADETWGYVDVRPGAHIFWWQYAASAPNPESLPTVMWLQGGPGASGTGYGNFAEFGKLDWNLYPRNSSWVNAPVNLLFVDSPVGAGYSYVDDISTQLPTTNAAIAADLVAVVTAFMAATPAASKQPFYVATESYGGKMVVDFSLAMLAAIDAGTVTADFRGIVIGDAWVSGIDSVDSWGPFLRATSLLDANGLAAVEVPTQACDAAVARGDWQEAINQWGAAENAVADNTDDVDFYNILKHGSAGDILSSTKKMSSAALALAPPLVDHDILQSLFTRHVGFSLTDPLNALMNGPIRTKLNSGANGKIIPDTVTWGGQSDAVFSTLSLDFMKPVTTSLDALLTTGRINVTVEEGQIDLICSNWGAEAWLKKLNWTGMADFFAAPRVPRYPSPTDKLAGNTGAFIKKAGILTKYDVLSAGHMVPLDSPWQALCMVRELTGLDNYNTLCA
jgi:serine carboxypeptidase 1